MNESLQLNDKQIEALRERELELLKIFISVCERLDLNYFAVEGTLLGAVRHRGFIPWDDDIDVGMLRDDYESFIENATELLPDGFFLQTRQTDSEYPHCFAKLRNTNTVFLETSCKNINMNHGIYIDIFPFDYYPDGLIKGYIFDFEKLLIKYRVREVFYVPEDSTLSVSNILRRILTLISRVRYKSVNDALERQEKLIKSFSNTKRVINNGSPWKNRERVDASWIASTVKLNFEGISINAPSGYDNYLKHVYGDYMTPPTEDKRIPHHYICAFDSINGINK